ncbi:ThiF family adenylyltransferase [Xylanimonas ulmi]|uniref:ThiF family protein n=1 Tax=Xylanimonas ulmi TaxID=228973 RepID=A0A4Q7M0D5_9MICO|nr:thiamine biosynthesis protein ThiF [Xylanibacterium ulmi]RZS59778.1 ThiF family protein [Xylanibacterium ulmi]
MTSDQTLARLRLRSGTPVLDRGGGEVQLGTDPRWALRLAGLDPAEVTWLRDLATRRHTSPVASADRLGVTPARRCEIVGVLRRGGFLHPAPPAGEAVAAVAAVGDGAADAPALGALRADGAGRRTLAGRARASVAVAGLGRLGAALAVELATAGVGTLVARDRAPVLTTDLGLGAYAPTDVGRPRGAALGEAVARVAPRTRVLPDGAADVVVLVEAHAPAPARYARLMGEGVAHLTVTVREADVVVGPFVLPGVTACARCADLHRADEDPAWPALAAQLRQVSEPPQETALAAGAAAVASAQVLAHLDGIRPASAGSLVELALPQVLPLARELRPHRRCGCVTLSRE